MRFLRPLRPGRTLYGLAAISIAAGAAAAAGAQAAEAGAVSGAFGNTVISTYPDGRSQKIWLHPDGRWDGLSRSNRPLAGTWSAKGDKVCLKQSKPPTLPVSFCTQLPERAEPGVQWTSRDVGGTPIRLSLQKGVSERAHR